MGKFDIFEIKLEKPGPCLSSAVISGDVLLRIKKDMDVHRVCIYLFGGGQVEFLRMQESGVTGPRNTFEDKEEYVKMGVVLFTRSNQNAVVNRICRNELYRFKFEFHLPKNLPSSFMSVIYYKLTAFLDCGGKSYETTVPMVVIDDFDLNEYEGKMKLLDPIDTWVPLRNRLANTSNNSGLISVRMSTAKRGYAIGEAISLQVEIYNNSKTKLDNINVCLVQKSTLKAYGLGGISGRRHQNLLVKHGSLGKLKNGERLVVEEVKIPIPWVVTSGVERLSRLFEIDYYIQITSSTPLISAISGASVSQVVSIGPEYKKCETVSVMAEEEIVVGMRALRDNHAPLPDMETEEAGAVAAVNGGDDVLPTAPPPPESADWTMFTMIPSAPPSYDEAMNEKPPLPDSPQAPSSD